MADPTIPQVSTGEGNTVAKMTKMLFSPVETENNNTTINKTAQDVIGENTTQKEDPEDWLKKEDQLTEQANNEIKKTNGTIPSTKMLFTENVEIKNNIPEIKTENVEIKNDIPEIKTENVEIKNNIPEIKTENVEIKNNIPEIKTENVEIKNVIPEIKTENNIEKIPTNELEKDMKIIQDIQQTPKIPTTPETNISSTQSENVLNLDSIGLTIPVPETEKKVLETTKPQIPENPYDNLQNAVAKIAPSIKKIGNKENKYIGIGAIVILLILGRFVLKTMYPIQYEDSIQEIAGTNEEETIITPEETPLTGEIIENGEGIETGEILITENESGSILLESGSLLDSGILETITEEETTETNHGAPEAEENVSIEEFKIQIQGFAEQGKTALEEGKKTNNKDNIKYGTILQKKSETYLQNLANGEEINTDKMTNIISELGSYLTKISPSINDNIYTSGQTNSTQENNTSTSGWEFNPDNFFGN